MALDKAPNTSIAIPQSNRKGPHNSLVSHNSANGRDEMNFADQPLGVLDEETARTQKTRVLSMGSYGTLTIKPGSDGLLTVDDEEVLLALMFLARKKTGFYEETLEFTRGELLEILQRPHKGQSYDQIKLSIDRLMDVSLTYENSWWDKQVGGRISTKFHIIDSSRVYKIGETASKTQTRCSIRWGKEFLASCQAGYVCKLDLRIQFDLRSPVAKTLRRFLNKKFYNQEELSFELRRLAQIVGLSDNYKSVGKIKEKLKTGLEELKTIGFLKSYNYARVSRGEWRIQFQRGEAWRASSNPDSFESEDEERPTRAIASESKPEVIETTATVLPTPPKSQPKSQSQSQSKPAKTPIQIQKTSKTKQPVRRIPKKRSKPQSRTTNEATESIQTPSIVTPPPAIASELIARGVSESEAVRLASERDQAYLTQKIDEFDYRMETNHALTNPGAFLATSIRSNYAAPAGYIPRAEREQKAQEQAQRQAAAQAQAAQTLQAKVEEAQLGCLARAVGADNLVKLGEEDLNRHPEKWSGIDPKGPLARGMKAGTGKEVIRKELQEKGAKATAKGLGVEKKLKGQGCIEWGGKQCQMEGCQRRKGLTLEEVAELNKPRAQ